MEINFGEACKSYLNKTRKARINCLIGHWIIRIVNALTGFPCSAA